MTQKMPKNSAPSSHANDPPEELTPAQQWAGFLTAVATHLHQHPDLCPVNLFRYMRVDVQVQHAVDPERFGAELVRWADTLEPHENSIVCVQVIRMDHRAHCYVHGTVGGYPVNIHEVVTGLLDAFDDGVLPDDYTSTWISVEGLRSFVERGDAPSILVEQTAA